MVKGCLLPDPPAGSLRQDDHGMLPKRVAPFEQAGMGCWPVLQTRFFRPLRPYVDSPDPQVASPFRSHNALFGRTTFMPSVTFPVSILARRKRPFITK